MILDNPQSAKLALGIDLGLRSIFIHGIKVRPILVIDLHDATPVIDLPDWPPYYYPLSICKPQGM